MDDLTIAIRVAFQYLPFAVSLTLGLLVPVLTLGLYRSLPAGALWVIGCHLFNTMLFEQAVLNIGIRWYLPDLFIGLLALVTVLRYTFEADARLRAPALYIYLAVVVINLVQGLVQIGSGAGVAARPSFYALVCCLYAMSFPIDPKRLRGIYGAIVAGAIGYLLLAVYRGAVTALDVRELLPPSGSFQPAAHSVWRVISSDETLLLAAGGFSLAYAWRVSPRWRTARFLVPLVLLAVVALQHRSVWLASLIVFFVSLASAAKGRDGLKRLIPVFVIATAIAAGALALGGGSGGSGLGGDIARSTQDAIELRGTAGERLGSWRQLVLKWTSSGPREMLLGSPAGTSQERYVSDDLSARKITYQAHNFYVETLTTRGLIGTAALLGVFAGSLRTMWRLRSDPELGDPAQWMLMLLAIQMAYYLTYGVNYMFFLWLGAALSLGARGGFTASSARTPQKYPWLHPQTGRPHRSEVGA